MTENYSVSKKNKIVVIGAGNVGQAIAYTLMVRRQANDIVIIDKDTEKAEQFEQLQKFILSNDRRAVAQLPTTLIDAFGKKCDR